jgi:hypothetical protein
MADIKNKKGPILRAIAQLHSGRALKRKAILNFSFSLEGNAAKRQRVYEVKNDNVAPLLLYAGPTLPDLEILCRIATWGRSLRYVLAFPPDTVILSEAKNLGKNSKWQKYQ